MCEFLTKHHLWRLIYTSFFLTFCIFHLYIFISLCYPSFCLSCSHTHSHKNTQSIISSVPVEDHALMLSGLCLWLWASAASMNHICFSLPVSRHLSLFLSLPLSQFPISIFLCPLLPRDGEMEAEKDLSDWSFLWWSENQQGGVGGGMSFLILSGFKSQSTLIL